MIIKMSLSPYNPEFTNVLAYGIVFACFGGERAFWLITYSVVCFRQIVLGPELQCLLKVKQDLRKVLIFQHAIFNAK